MDKNKLLTIGGVIGVVAGTAALFLSGTDESTVVSTVAAVFVLAGAISLFFKK